MEDLSLTDISISFNDQKHIEYVLETLKIELTLISSIR